MKRLFPAALLSALLPALLHAQVILNEIMYYPDANEPEWVELYNAGTEAVTIQGWTIREDSNSSGSVPFEGIIPAGGYFVVTGDLEAFTERWGEIPSAVVRAEFSYLNNTGGDCVRLRGEENETIDEVCYEDSWGGRNGKSLERRSPAAASGEPTTWGTCIAVGKGTPGEANSLTASGVATEFEEKDTPLQLFPNPAADHVQLRFTADEISENERIEIFDFTGRLLQSVPVRSGEMMLPLGAFSSGIYMLRINDGGTNKREGFFTIVR